jgi:hypothetical protein
MHIVGGGVLPAGSPPTSNPRCPRGLSALTATVCCVDACGCWHVSIWCSGRDNACTPKADEQRLPWYVYHRLSLPSLRAPIAVRVGHALLFVRENKLPLVVALRFGWSGRPYGGASLPAGRVVVHPFRQTVLPPSLPPFLPACLPPSLHPSLPPSSQSTKNSSQSTKGSSQSTKGAHSTAKNQIWESLLIPRWLNEDRMVRSLPSARCRVLVAAMHIVCPKLKADLQRWCVPEHGC